MQSMPAEHRIPCLSYSLEIRRAGLFDAQRAREAGVPLAFWNRLQKGGNRYGRLQGEYTPGMVLGEPRRGIKVAYCTDTRPTAQLALLARASDLLVCEGIYGGGRKTVQRHGEKAYAVF